MNLIRENYSLKAFNTFGIDQNAEYFAEIQTNDELIAILKSEQWQNKPYLILGGGSNILLCGDIKGLVIKINTKGIEHKISNNDVFVTAQAGEIWHDFVCKCVQNNWGGIENLSLIPGCVGASPIQNIGAYGVEVKDVIHNVEVLNIHTLTIENFNNSDCKFGYRESVFKNEYKGKYIVTSVTYKLTKNPSINSSYGAINDILLRKNISNPTIADISNAIIEIRQSKLPDPKVIGNAGSFFKNPEVEEIVYSKIKESYPDVPSFQGTNNLIKVPAGWLIEKAGWKGRTFENYGVHKNQALVLVNYGNAKGIDIKNLASEIQNDVFIKFGIKLQNEVNYLES